VTRRPDLVDVWPFRVVDGRVEVLLLHRSVGRVLAGLWQGVSGLVEDGERVTDAALREVAEETGYGDVEIESFYHLDYAAEFLWQPVDALMTSAYFAVRIRPGIDPHLSHEHDAFRWLPIDDAIAMAVWPEYREGLTRIRDVLFDPAREPWFRLDPDGPRPPKPPR
jgi:dihydroneopterin triphosphate diphosphatase